MSMYQDLMADPTESLLTNPRDDSGGFAWDDPDKDNLEESLPCRAPYSGAMRLSDGYLTFLESELLDFGRGLTD